jgi:hypothetical protein
LLQRSIFGGGTISLLLTTALLPSHFRKLPQVLLSDSEHSLHALLYLSRLLNLLHHLHHAAAAS